MGYVLGAGGSVVITEALLPPGDGRAQVQAARVRPAQRADWREGGRGRRGEREGGGRGERGGGRERRREGGEERQGERGRGEREGERGREGEGAGKGEGQRRGGRGRGCVRQCVTDTVHLCACDPVRACVTVRVCVCGHAALTATARLAGLRRQPPLDGLPRLWKGSWSCSGQASGTAWSCRGLPWGCCPEGSPALGPPRPPGPGVAGTPSRAQGRAGALGPL